jgi:hypothetical protein
VVEILKRGTPYEQRYMQLECKRCLSLLKFRGDEAVKGVDISWIVCPVCEQNVNVAGATAWVPA